MNLIEINYIAEDKDLTLLKDDCNTQCAYRDKTMRREEINALELGLYPRMLAIARTCKKDLNTICSIQINRKQHEPKYQDQRKDKTIYSEGKEET
jgi:hypothetical protein